MAEQRPFDPQAWLNEFRRFQADRAAAVNRESETPSIGIEAYVQRAYAQSQERTLADGAGDTRQAGAQQDPRETPSLADQVDALRERLETAEQEQAQALEQEEGQAQAVDRAEGMSY